MARRIKGSRKGKGEAADDVKVARRNGLEEAWPSSPGRPPRYVISCVNHENDRRVIFNSYGCYAIRKIFDALVGENEILPSSLDPDHTMTFGDIDIKSDQMSAILNHQYSKDEEEWELSSPYVEQIDKFITGGRITQSLEQRDASGSVIKPERKAREPKPVKERIDRAQFITVQQLATEVGIDPRDARAALRKAKIEKPTGGWLGDEAWAKGIKDVLAKAAKELKGRK